MSDGESVRDVKVRVDGLAVGGAWIGEITGGAAGLIGKKAFVREAAAGEEICAEVIREERNFAVARLLRVERASPHRVTPACPVFGKCGGCDLQHLDLAAQRESKRKMVESMLAKQAKLAPKHGVQLIGAELPGFGYRRRITLHLSHEGEIGFFAEGSGIVVPISSCPIASATINGAFSRERGAVAAQAAAIGGWVIEESGGELFHVLLMREEAGGAAAKSAALTAAHNLAGLSNLKIVRNGKELFSRYHDAAGGEFPSGHFSQVNAGGNLVLQEAVLARVSAPQVADLYAGSGNFSLPLAEQGRNVVAVDADPDLVRFGRALAAERGLESRLSFVESSCERYVKSAPSLPASVVLDPPRAGAKNVVGRLAEKGARQVIYVSCSLPTLTRDSAALAALGWSLDETLVLDMFSQTHHVETVSVFTKSS